MGTILHEKPPDNNGNLASGQKKVRDRNEAPASPTQRSYERRGGSPHSVIDEAKRLVPVIDLADLLCGPGGMHRMGAEWVARCPLPDHDDGTPSFAANPEKNLFFCHGCVRGGDVVELYRLAHGFDEREAHLAAGYLLLEFGHDVPPRPPAWFRKQERQRPVRDAIEQTRKNIYRRRVFKLFVLPALEHIEDPKEYEREARRAWEDLKRFLP